MQKVQVHQRYKHVITGSVILIDDISDFNGITWVYYTKLTNNTEIKNKFMKPLYSVNMMYKSI